MDAFSATSALAGGLLHSMSSIERKAAQNSEPTLESSRFWVVGRRHSEADHNVLAWSPVRQVAKAVAQLAVALGMHEVTLVDCETEEEERFDKAA